MRNVVKARNSHILFHFGSLLVLLIIIMEAFPFVFGIRHDLLHIYNYKRDDDVLSATRAGELKISCGCIEFLKWDKNRKYIHLY